VMFTMINFLNHFLHRTQWLLNDSCQRDLSFSCMNM
jgi:hypothetical protein